MGQLSVSNVSKAYRRYSHKWGRAAEWLGLGVHHELRWVLEDVTFEVRPGESVGIIGTNGAGKSTLLKIITGTISPSCGHVSVAGRIAALLELGIGFHQDFTGRENIYMSAQLSGMPNELIEESIDSIISFAEIGDYIDQPVRTYSSGMQVRLAFSVATAVRPEILIVDEALSVGDIFFQQKCFDRIRAYREEGTTLLFVTHSMGTIYSLCDRAIMLDRGRLVLDDKPKPVIDAYQAKELERINSTNDAGRRVLPKAGEQAKKHESTPVSGSQDMPLEDKEKAAQVFEYGDFSTENAQIENVRFTCAGESVAAVVSESLVCLEVVVSFLRDCDDPHVGFQIRNSRGEPIFMTNSYCMGKHCGPVKAGQVICAKFDFSMPIAPDDYTVTVGIANRGYGEGYFAEALARKQNAAVVTVMKNIEAISWTGVCNLYPKLTTVVLEKQNIYE